MYGYRGRGLAGGIIIAILGIGLCWNSARGLVSREGMYDEQSTASMTFSSWLGMAAGLLMAAAGGWVTWFYVGPLID